MPNIGVADIFSIESSSRRTITSRGSSRDGSQNQSISDVILSGRSFALWIAQSMSPLSKAASSASVKKSLGLFKRLVFLSRSPFVLIVVISNRCGAILHSILLSAPSACVIASLLGRVPTLKIIGDFFI